MRSRGLKVSLTEWLSLLEALYKGLALCSLIKFYYLCRQICVKKESQFDLYDQCFAEYFAGVEQKDIDLDEFLKWLGESLPPKRDLSPEELAQIKHMDFETLRKEFEKRLEEQKEKHDGGNRWVGTGGTSPFGHSGYHPGGIRVGGSSSNRSAAQIATERKFKNLRNDRIIDVRQMGLALKRLRKFSRLGLREELDIDETIKKTANNAGDLELIFSPERKNNIKVLLIMDVGGSMTPFAKICETLFSAAYQATHFKAFEHYFFHNCPYEVLFKDIYRQKGLSTLEIMKKYDSSWSLIMVGDAAMHPYELTEKGGAIDYFYYNKISGLEWLKKLEDHFNKSVWLNPEPEPYWEIPSNYLIRKVFEMYPLSLNGISDAIGHLTKNA